MNVVLLVISLILHNRTKHFEIDLYLMHDKVIQKQLQISHIPSPEQVADVFIKSISPP